MEAALAAGDSQQEVPMSGWQGGKDNFGDDNDDDDDDNDDHDDHDDNDNDDCSDAKDDENKEAHWKRMDLRIGELVILNGVGKGDKWWVGKVTELIDVVWDKEQPELHEGDIEVHAYSGCGLNSTFKPLKREPTRRKVWSHCADQWNSEDKILNFKGKLLNDVKERVGKEL